MNTESEALLRDALVWDNHACMPLRPDDDSFLPQLERAHRVGVNAITLNIGFGQCSREQHLAVLRAFRRWIEARPEQYCLANSVADIERAAGEGRLAVLFDIEGMALLDDGDLDLIDELRRQGVGWMLVAYNRANHAGGGCMDDEDPGLSEHGRRVLSRMREVGMIACCSHTGHRTARDVIENAGNPVIFSHSNAAAVHAHPRNIPDELARACAAGGGVVGVTGIGAFLGEGTDYAELLARHVDHYVQLLGPAHVGLSLDYVYDQQELIDYLQGQPETFGSMGAIEEAIRMAPPEVLPAFVDRLLGLGYDGSALAAILGGNWRRVASTVWEGRAGDG